jgi:hypothetical protein
MLVNLTSTDNELTGYKNFNQITSFARSVADSEAQKIYCENFLSSFDYNDVPGVVNLILKKLRMGSTLTIIEPDFELISRQIFREEIPVSNVNQIIFKDKKVIKCFLTSEAVESLITDERFAIISKRFDSHNFTLVVKRIS